MKTAERLQLQSLVARSDVALAKLDRYRHDVAPTLEREALRRLRAEHETIKALVGELAVEGEDDEGPEEAA